MKTEFIIAKTLGLAQTAILYFAFAIVASIVLNFLTKAYETYTTPADPKYEKSTLRLIFEISANIFFIALTFWVIRNAVERIPFVLEGYGGYRHTRNTYNSVPDNPECQSNEEDVRAYFENETQS